MGFWLINVQWVLLWKLLCFFWNLAAIARSAHILASGTCMYMHYCSNNIFHIFYFSKRLYVKKWNTYLFSTCNTTVLWCATNYRRVRLAGSFRQYVVMISLYITPPSPLRSRSLPKLPADSGYDSRQDVRKNWCNHDDDNSRKQDRIIFSLVKLIATAAEKPAYYHNVRCFRAAISPLSLVHI